MIKLPPLKNRKTVFLAIGNIMRADDAFGPMVYEELLHRKNPLFLPLNGAEMPESMTGKIKAFAPDFLILADAAALPGKPAGFLQLVDEDDIINPSLSTHTLPLNMMLKFLKEDLPALKILFIAAAAAYTDFDREPAPAIAEAAKNAAKAVLAALDK